MNKIVVVDSDAIFALYNPNDPLNKRTIKTFTYLIEHDYQIIYPTSVIFEVISLFQRVLPTPEVTQKLIDMIKDEEITTYAIDGELLKASATIFNPHGSKKNTFIDCSVVAIARHTKADAVFSYDSFYKKQDLKLAEDILT